MRLSRNHTGEQQVVLYLPCGLSVDNTCPASAQPPSSSALSLTSGSSIPPGLGVGGQSWLAFFPQICQTTDLVHEA